MILVLDNRDSFTYNLAALLHSAGGAVEVLRTDRVTIDDVRAIAPQGLVISPGPGRPEDATLSLAAVTEFAGRVPILGVCLGMQCIATAFGAVVGPTHELVHGMTSPVHHGGDDIFHGVRSPVPCVRYHSLAVQPETLPHELEMIASTTSGVAMAIRHVRADVIGVQFHPESIGTEGGERMVRTWVTTRGLVDER